MLGVRVIPSPTFSQLYQCVAFLYYIRVDLSKENAIVHYMRLQWEVVRQMTKASYTYLTTSSQYIWHVCSSRNLYHLILPAHILRKKI